MVCALIVMRHFLVNDVAVKFGVSLSRLMEVIRADMVLGSGELRYGLAKFYGRYYVQVMRGALRFALVFGMGCISLGGTEVVPHV